MDEIELEVFRADTRASRGITAEHIADAAASYDAETAPAGICLGHPKNDTPAFGRVKSFRADGNSLFATIPVDPGLVEGVKADRLLNRSMAFFSPTHEANPVPGKLYPRHLGFLGASAPGIPGMTPLTKALAFAADGETLEATGAPADAILFEAAPTAVVTVHEGKEPEQMSDTPTTPTAEEIEAKRKELDDREREFNARQEQARKASNDAIVDGLLAGGKVLPTDVGPLKLVFGALNDGELEFAADRKTSPAAELARILGGAVKLVPVDEGRHSPSGEFSADDLKSDPAKITAAAKKLQEAEPNLSFEAAVERVTAG